MKKLNILKLYIQALLHTESQIYQLGIQFLGTFVNPYGEPP